MGVQINQANQRMVFENARQVLAASGYSVERAKLTMSEIRSEVAMSASTSQYHVPILVNDSRNGNPFLSERRLNTSDVFLVSGIGIYASEPSASTAAAGRLYTYGNPTIFSTANCATAINAAYANGFLYGLIDNEQVLPYWAALKHFRAPETQDASPVATAVDSFTGASDGVFPCEPNLVLAGNANIDFNFSTVSNMAAVETASRWVFMFYGVLAQNCSATAN